MIALSLLVVLSSGQEAKGLAAEFFFLKPGVTRYYTSTTDGADLETVDTVGEMELLGSQTVWPIKTKIKSYEGEKAYYTIHEEAVYLYADWDLKKLDPPVPILKAGEGELKWTYKSGETSMVYTTKPGKTQKVFGKDLPTLDFSAKGSDGNDQFATHVEQTAVYAKGVGMIEMTETRKTAKTKVSRTVKLTKISGGGW
jgi:hypothetical protein